MSLQQIEERISDSLVSRAEEASKLRIRVIALEQLIRMIGASTSEPDVLKLVALMDAEKIDVQAIVKGFMLYHGRKTTKTHPDCTACEGGHGLLGSGCICGSRSQSDRGGVE